MTATVQVTDTVEETFTFGSDPIYDEDTTLSDNNNCYTLIVTEGGKVWEASLTGIY